MNRKFSIKLAKIIVFIIICLVCVILLGKFYDCPFKKYFGFDCPGCGVTRAAYLLLKFDFISAFKYNPSIFALVIIFSLAIFDYLFEKLTYEKIRLYLILAGAALFITWIIKIMLQFAL